MIVQQDKCYNLHMKKKYLIVGLVILAVLVLIWAELAVGVFGTPFAGS